MGNTVQRRKRKPQAGFTLAEVLIAGLVMIFGLLALSGLFATAIGDNGRSRVDSTATMLSQSVMEQISAVLARGGPAAVMDCANPPTTWPINTNVGGAALSGSGIDFTETSPPTGYHMDFVVCNGGGEANTTATYDVRWHISVVTPVGGTDCSHTCLVTVAARPVGMTAGRFTFALPVTFRTYVGPQ